MKKKIVLGSIFAVVILIFLSFTNVVGYRTNNSDSVEKSLLFSVRTRRATEQDDNLYSSNYIDKGKDVGFSIPKRDNRKALLLDVIARISQMDDKSFNKLIITAISRLNQDNKLQDIDAKKIILTLNLLRTNPDKVEDYIIAEKNNYFEDTYYICTFVGWYPGCFLFSLLYSILLFIGSLIMIWLILISWNIPTCIFYGTCGGFTECGVPTCLVAACSNYD